LTCAFHSDLATSEEAIQQAREELLVVVDSLGEGDVERARRGGWTVGRVLEHVIHSERLYAQMAAYLNGVDAGLSDRADPPASSAEAVTRLNATRGALRAALEGVGEEAFYKIGRIGHEEYSVLSILENVANHDREHAAQIQAIIEDKSAGGLTPKPEDLIN